MRRQPVPSALAMVPLGPAIALALVIGGLAGRRRGPVGPAQTRPGGAVAGGGRDENAWRRLRAAWVTLTGTGAAASVAFGLLVFASVLASLAIPRESAELRTGALQRVIAASPPGDQAVTATAVLVEISRDRRPVQASASRYRRGRRRLAVAAGRGRGADRQQPARLVGPDHGLHAGYRGGPGRRIRAAAVRDDLPHGAGPLQPYRGRTAPGRQARPGWCRPR